MKPLLVILACWAAVQAYGQETNPAPQPVRTANDVWILRLTNPPREYAVRLGALQTVTLQEYDRRKADKVQRIVEMTIETAGGNMARFLWEDKAKSAAEMSDELEQKRREVEEAMEDVTGVKPGEENSRRLQKDYPATTHSPWAEFRLDAESDVRDLHQKLMEMWTGRKRE